MTNLFLQKSKEAFLLAIEIYNKPTIKYRVEGFSFFTCNAWELMLKAHIVKKFGMEAIYYEGKKDRTISLDNCINKIFTNEKAPLRKNLTKIIELRNISTHFVIEEYEMVYIPLFQACVLNFVEKMQEFHNIDMTKEIPQNFLTLSVSLSALDENVIRAKYPEEIANKIMKINSQIEPIINENNRNFAIKIEHYHFITKDKNKATSFVHVSKNAEAGVKILKEYKDPNATHKYTMKTINKEVNARLRSKGVEFNMNQYIFRLFDKVYDLKNNPDYCFIYKAYAQPTYMYSAKVVSLITEEILKNPNGIVENLKAKK